MPQAKRKPRKKPPGLQSIEWIEAYCRIPEGRDVGQLVKLRRWQKTEIRKIYDNAVPTRRAIISFGRKNAKTTLAAFLLLLHLCGPRYKRNTELYSTAQSKEQASVIFDAAAKIIRMSADLRSVVVIRDHSKELWCPELGTKYRALANDPTTALGLKPAFIVHDELGQVRGPFSRMFEAMETATGSAESPLSIIISTQAATDADFLSVLIDSALAGHDPHVVVSLYTAPIDADPFSEATIKLANPAYGDFLNAVEVKAMANDARMMPGRESFYRNLVLNQRVEANDPFVSHHLWLTCGAKPKPIDDVPVYGGLDLSEVRDLTALVLIGQVDGVWQVHPTFWLPGEGLAAKSRADRVPYDHWHRQGHLIAAPGKSIDYEWVAVWLRQQFDHYDIKKLAFDRWNFKHLRAWLLKAGFSEAEIEEKFEEFGQGFQSMSPALHNLEGEILNGRIAHGDHPVLAMCANNAVLQTDPAGNRKLTKAKSTGRIDGMVALTMAMGVSTSTAAEPAPTYQMLVFG